MDRAMETTGFEPPQEGAENAKETTRSHVR